MGLACVHPWDDPIEFTPDVLLREDRFVEISDYIFPVFFLPFIAIFLFRYIRSGSLAGALLGGRIKRTVGEISLSASKLTSRVMQVHVMESAVSGERPYVALSVVSKAPLGASMVPIKLTMAQAQELVTLLQQATSGRLS